MDTNQIFMFQLNVINSNRKETVRFTLIKKKRFMLIMLITYNET